MSIKRKILGYSNRRWGMTFAEMMISLAIGSTMMMVVMLASADIFKNYTAAMEYRNIHENARRALAYLSRDIRSGVSLTSYSTSDITLSIVGIAGTTNSVRYYLSNNNLLRSETASGVTTSNLLTDHITSVSFERWTNPGTPATTLSDTYEIRVFLTVTNSGSFRLSSDLLQTRALMRNKP